MKVLQQPTLKDRRGGTHNGQVPSWIFPSRLLRRTAAQRLCLCQLEARSATVTSHTSNQSNTYRVFNAQQAAQLLRDLGTTAKLCLLLPRNLYLQRLLEIPHVASGEAQAILGLEVLASLPPKYGDFEFSCRQLASRKEGLDCYEVYIARRVDIEAFLASARELGLRTDVVLPSAVIWSAILNTANGADVLLAPVGPGHIEVAGKGQGGAIMLRTLDVPRQEDLSSDAIAVRISETIRSLMPHRSGTGGRQTVAWLGGPAALKGSILEQAVDQSVLNSAAEASGIELSDENPYLAFAAATMAAASDPAIRLADITPQHECLQREQQRVRKEVIMALALLFVALMLSFGGMWIRTWRLRSEAADLTRQLSLIRKDGELVAMRVQQLDAICSIRATRGDFAVVVESLCAATPKGISYSTVELADNGTVRLQGQAESLELPFRLVESLEKQPRLSEVIMRDASRSRRGNGSVAEFRVDFRVAKGVTP